MIIIFRRPDKPSPPRDVGVSEVYADHCTVDWKPPADDGGGTITGTVHTFHPWQQVFNTCVLQMVLSDNDNGPYQPLHVIIFIDHNCTFA